MSIGNLVMAVKGTLRRDAPWRHGGPVCCRRGRQARGEFKWWRT